MDEPTIQQLFDLRGRTAMITGASGHLGGAMARALAEAGASVIVTSRDADRGNAVARSLPSPHGARHAAVTLDYLDEASLQRGFDEAVSMAGCIDILVNNAHQGVAGNLASATADAFNRQIALAAGYYLLSRHIHNHAVQHRRPASIIMLGSMYGMVGSYPAVYEGVCDASPVAYHALKGGVLQMTRHMAVFWARDQVRVNSLSPGAFPSPKLPAELTRRVAERSPMARIGVPEDLKGAVLFLASDASSFMTGQNLVIDGGWTAW